ARGHPPRISKLGPDEPDVAPDVEQLALRPMSAVRYLVAHAIADDHALADGIRSRRRGADGEDGPDDDGREGARPGSAHIILLDVERKPRSPLARPSQGALKDFPKDLQDP